MCKTENYAFIEWPRQIARSDYDEAVGRYLSRVCEREDVRSVYQFGSVTVPGISDIDLIVVVKESLIAHNFDDIKLRIGDNLEGKRVFLHNPIIVPDVIWPKLNWLHTFQSLTLLSGDSLPAPEPVPQRYLSYISAATGIEFAVRQLHWIAKMCLLKRISVRSALAIIQSSTYLGDLINHFGCGIYNAEFERHRELVKEIRGSWFEKGNVKLLLESLKRTVTLISHFISEVSGYLSEIFTQKEEVALRKIRHSENAVSYFSDSPVDSKLIANGRVRRLFGRDFYLSELRLPKEIGLHYLVCALVSGDKSYRKFIMSRLINSTVTENWLSNLPQLYISAMQRRMKVADEQMNFLLRHNVGAGYIIDCGCFDLSGKPGWRRILREAPWKVLQYLFVRCWETRI